MNQCIIESCPNEARLVAKSGGRSYYACKKHEKEVGQIVIAEHTKGEIERMEHVGSVLYSKEEKNKVPNWIGF